MIRALLNVIQHLLGVLIDWVMGISWLARLADKVVRQFPSLHERLFQMAMARGIDTDSALRPEEGYIDDIDEELLTRRGQELAQQLSRSMANARYKGRQ